MQNVDSRRSGLAGLHAHVGEAGCIGLCTTEEIAAPPSRMGPAASRIMTMNNRKNELNRTPPSKNQEKVERILDRSEELLDRLLGHLGELQEEQREPDPEDRLWDIDEVANYLDVSKRTVETLINEGDLEPIRVRSLRRFDPSEVRGYCERMN